MKMKLVLAAFASACCAAPASAQMEALKGKIKEGLYEMKMEMEMPGMPQGMGGHAMTMQHCVTAKDIESGKVGKGPDAKDAAQCEVRDFRMSGNTATYKVVCKGEQAMTADTTMTFRDNGYVMTTKVAMTQGGQSMNMTQKFDARYLGACKK